MGIILLISEIEAILFHPLSLILFLLLILVTKGLLATTSDKNLPPSPYRLPIIGNLHQLGLHPHRSLHSLAQRYGSILLLHLGREPTVVISSANLAREIMKTHDLNFANRPDSRIASQLLYDHKDLSLSPYGEYWRQMRSICVLQLLTAKRVQSFRSIREEETELVIKKVNQSCASSSPVDLSELFASVTNDVICRVAFGRKYNEVEGGKTFKLLLGELGTLLGMFNVGDFIPWLAWLDYFTGLNARVGRIFQEFDHFLDGVLDAHLQSRSENGVRENGMDFVDVLIQIQKDGRSGFCLGRDNIKAIILDMFAGGADTTYTALEWAMTEVIRHPDTLKKAQKEIRGMVGSKPSIDEVDISKMQFLKALIKETLRLHPPLPLLLPRVSAKDVQIGGYDVSANTRVVINAWTIGREAGTWEEGEKFRPERFLERSIDFKGRDFEFIPFGAGRRSCPGTTFAVANVELVLASLLHKFNWALPDGDTGEGIDVNESTGIAIHRKLPLVLVASPRSD